MSKPEVVVAQRWSDAVTTHGEGPFWSTMRDQLLAVDMLEGDVIAFNESGGVAERLHVGKVAACIRERVEGGYVIALERSIALADPHLQIVAESPRLIDADGVRFNDGSCAPDGSFLCGTMAFDQQAGRGSLFRYTPVGVLSQLLGDLTISNGIAFVDEYRARFIDTPTGRIDTLTFAGDVVSRETYVTIAAGDGSPDGLCLDTSGGTWVALWGGSSVHRYDVHGNLDLIVRVPVPYVTACAFGGPAGTTLYITTSALPEDAPRPQSGAVFAVETGFAGAPVLQFRA